MKRLQTGGEINAVASPIVPYKLYVVPLVALFDAVDTDGVPVRRVAGVTPGEVTEKIQHPNAVPEESNTEAPAWRVKPAVSELCAHL